jgi:hypothetical protein
MKRCYTRRSGRDRYEIHVRAADRTIAWLFDQLQAAADYAQSRDEVAAINAIRNRCEDPAGWLMGLANDRAEAKYIADARSGDNA